MRKGCDLGHTLEDLVDGDFGNEGKEPETVESLERGIRVGWSVGTVLLKVAVQA